MLFCSHAMTTVKMTLCSQINVKSTEFGRWFVTGPVLVPVFFDWIWLSKSVHVLISCMRFGAAHSSTCFAFGPFWVSLSFATWRIPTHISMMHVSTCMYVYTYTSLCTLFICTYICHMSIKQDQQKHDSWHLDISQSLCKVTLYVHFNFPQTKSSHNFPEGGVWSKPFIVRVFGGSLKVGWVVWRIGTALNKGCSFGHVAHAVEWFVWGHLCLVRFF